MSEPRPHRPLRIEQSPLERARLWIEILALMAAGCWAIYTFLYETKIAPLFLPPHEVVTLDVHRIAELPSSYVERCSVTIRNDSYVDIDAAGLAESVRAATAADFSHLSSLETPSEVDYRYLPRQAWKVVQSSGILLDGSVSGQHERHLLLRPNDSFVLQYVAVVPRSYSVLRMSFQGTFARYPIEPRIDAKLVKKDGAVNLRTDYISIGFDSFFGV